MRSRAFKLTEKQRRLIERMLADATLDIHAAAAELHPPVKDTQFIRWMEDPEFTAAIDRARAVQQMMLQQRATVRELTGLSGGSGRATQAVRPNSPAGDAGRVRETAKPTAEAGATAQGAHGGATANATALTAEQFDAVCRKASKEPGATG